MKRLLNTLYITNEKAYLSLKGENICVEIEGCIIARFPLHTLESVICFSFAGGSPALQGKCVEEGINISFFSPYGKFLYRACGQSKGNVLLRKEQYRISDDIIRSNDVAKNFILGKVFNCRWVIDRTLRDHELRVDADKCKRAITLLCASMKQIDQVHNMDQLRGLEGESASVYFGVYDDLILNQKEDFQFSGRTRRPPQDRVNAMLSYGYTLLAGDCAHALEGVGLDSYVGFMHRDRPGRKSLALDMMEELRPVMVDRFVLTLINMRQIRSEHFKEGGSGAVIFTEEGRKLFLKEWQENKRKEITHPFLKEKINWGLVPHIQAQLMARNIRGDLDAYPPFLWR